MPLVGFSDLGRALGGALFNALQELRSVRRAGCWQPPSPAPDWPKMKVVKMKKGDVVIKGGYLRKDGLKEIAATPGQGIYRGPTMSHWFKNAKKDTEVSKLLDGYMSTKEKHPLKPEVIEDMVRAKMLEFGIADLPESRNLRDWQAWFRKQKADKPTKKQKTGKRKRVRSEKFTDRQQDVYHLIETLHLTFAKVAARRGCTKQNISQLYKRANEKVQAIDSSRSVRATQTLPTGKRGEPLVES